MYQTVRLNEYQRVVKQRDIAIEALKLIPTFETICSKDCEHDFHSLHFSKDVLFKIEQALKQIKELGE